MSIKIGKIKLVWFENVFGWIMTGIIGPYNKWFFGYSEQPYPVHDNSDLSKTLQKATKPNIDIKTYMESNYDRQLHEQYILKIYAREIAILLRSSDLYMESANPSMVQLINVFERFSHGQASLEAVKLALYNFTLHALYPTILQYFLQQPQEVVKRVKTYVYKLPTIQQIIDRLAIVNDNTLVKLEIDYYFDKPCQVCGAEPDQQCSADDPDREGFAVELGSWIHRRRIED